MKSKLSEVTINPFAEVDRTQSIFNISMQIQKIAQHHRFDWSSATGVIAKLYEEIEEIVEADTNTPNSKKHLEEELGDLLFTAISLARHYAIDPETALIKANHKFERRFRSMVSILSEHGSNINYASKKQLEQAWCEAKKREVKPISE